MGRRGKNHAASKAGELEHVKCSFHGRENIKPDYNLSDKSQSTSPVALVDILYLASLLRFVQVTCQPLPAQTRKTLATSTSPNHEAHMYSGFHCCHDSPHCPGEPAR